MAHRDPDLLERDTGVEQALDHLEHEDVAEAVEPLRAGAGRRPDARLDQAGAGPVVELAVGDARGAAGGRAAVADVLVELGQVLGEEQALRLRGHAAAWAPPRRGPTASDVPLTPNLQSSAALRPPSPAGCPRRGRQPWNYIQGVPPDGIAAGSPGVNEAVTDLTGVSPSGPAGPTSGRRDPAAACTGGQSAAGRVLAEVLRGDLVEELAELLHLVLVLVRHRDPAGLEHLVGPDDPAARCAGRARSRRTSASRRSRPPSKTSSAWKTLSRIAMIRTSLEPAPEGGR